MWGLMWRLINTSCLPPVPAGADLVPHDRGYQLPYPEADIEPLPQGHARGPDVAALHGWW